MSSTSRFLIFLFALSAFFTGCEMDESTTGPATAPDVESPATFEETDTYQAIAQLEGGRELLARIPETAARRVHKSGSQLFLAYSTNTIEPGPEVVEFPLNSSYFRYEGFGIPVGKFSAEGPSLENFVTLTQVGSATFTVANGDQLDIDYSGTFTMDQMTGVVDFSGTIEFTGGTGRYEGASGDGGYAGQANVFTGTGEEIWYGVLMTTN